MIAAVRGILEARVADGAVVGVGGISLRILAPSSTLTRLPSPGEEVRLVTHLHVREDQISLFGFASDDELDLFERLMTVSGVGPKLALSILSAASTDTLRRAIAGGNTAGLTGIPGIGKKLAGRLVLELRGKLETGIAGEPVAPLEANAEVVEALTTLGYSPLEAQEAVRTLPTDRPLELEQKIRLALRYFART